MKDPGVTGALRKAGTADQLLTRVRDREEAFKALFPIQELDERDLNLNQLRSDANFSPLIEHFAVGSDETFRMMLDSFAEAHSSIVEVVTLRSDLLKIWFSHVGRELAVFPHFKQLQKHVMKGEEWCKKVEARFEEIEQYEDATQLMSSLKKHVFDYEIPQEEWERKVREERWKNFIESPDVKKAVPKVVLEVWATQVPDKFTDGWREVLQKRIRTRYEGFYKQFISPLNAEVGEFSFSIQC
jgi:hypothetical protein